MFRFAADGRVRWPVTVQQVQDDGSTAEHTVLVTYVRLTRDELRARNDAWLDISAQLDALKPAEGNDMTPALAIQRTALLQQRVDADDVLLRARLVGWSGIADAGGNPLAYSDELRDAMLRDELLRRVLLAGLIDASDGVREKNSLPGLAGLPAPAQG